MKPKPITFNRRRTVVRSEVATFYRRYDKTRRFCICEIESHFGLSRRVLALVNDHDGERVVSRHRGVGPAKESLEKLAKGKK